MPLVLAKVSKDEQKKPPKPKKKKTSAVQNEVFCSLSANYEIKVKDNHFSMHKLRSFAQWNKNRDAIMLGVLLNGLKSDNTICSVESAIVSMADSCRSRMIFGGYIRPDR